MGQTATIGRTVVVGAYLLALVVVGRPVWLALLLGVLLTLVWAAPIGLAPALRRRSTGAGPVLGEATITFPRRCAGRAASGNLGGSEGE